VEPFVGARACRRLPTREIFLTKENVNRTVNGQKEGLWVTRYANGQVRSEGTFKSGVKDGSWTLYHQNGNLQSEATFVNGHYSGYYCSYHENGHKFREGEYNVAQGNSADGRKEGVWHQFLPDGETIEWRVTYKRGRVVERIIRPEK
jgi:antitoxin component YwqK of YwqJK toxin-antitoxin module